MVEPSRATFAAAADKMGTVLGAFTVGAAVAGMMAGTGTPVSVEAGADGAATNCTTPNGSPDDGNADGAADGAFETSAAEGVTAACSMPDCSLAVGSSAEVTSADGVAAGTLHDRCGSATDDEVSGSPASTASDEVTWPSSG